MCHHLCIIPLQTFDGVALRDLDTDCLYWLFVDGERYIVCLKEASALWQLYIEELIAANEIALGMSTVVCEYLPSLHVLNDN